MRTLPAQHRDASGTDNSHDPHSKSGHRTFFAAAHSFVVATTRTEAAQPAPHSTQRVHGKREGCVSAVSYHTLTFNWQWGENAAAAGARCPLFPVVAKGGVERYGGVANSLSGPPSPGQLALPAALGTRWSPCRRPSRDAQTEDLRSPTSTGLGRGVAAPFARRRPNRGCSLVRRSWLVLVLLEVEAVVKLYSSADR